MSGQQFCLRWNNHQPNFISVCSSLLNNGTLVDVTLAAEGKQLQAHKIVLSACSSYFQALFTTNPCQHPIVILKDVQYNDLKTMVDFMYYGEVNVSQEQLPHILKTAEMLKIKGLAEMPADAATLTKSESKSSVEQTPELHGSIGTNTSGAGCSSGADSIWGSTESQQQHQQQYQQQSMHQQKRTPSPVGINASPSTRRKRLRKTSNNGSGERNSEDHSSLETGGMNMGQLGQMSFAGSSPNLSQNIHAKIIKDGSGVGQDIETHHHSSHHHHHPHDSSQESIDEATHAHHLQHIKPEADIITPQSIPLDISDATTPDHETSNANQSAHTGVQWTVVDSNYPRFSLSSCQASLIGGTGGAGGGGNDGDNVGDNTNGATNDNSTSNEQRHHQQHASNSAAQQQLQMHYQNSNYPPQIIAVNNLVTGYAQQQQQHQQNMSTPTSPNDSSMVQSVYSSQGPTPTHSPVHQMQQHQHQISGGGSKSQQQQVKRKRSVNPQGETCFIQALEAVKSGGIGFCKAAKIFGVNNRTLWLEYKKRGYPISRPSLKSRIVKQENLSPSPTPTNDDGTMENYDHLSQQQAAHAALNMQVPPQSETPTPSIMCSTQTHPHAMNVMSFLDTRHIEFPTAAGIHTMSRQRFNDGSGGSGATTTTATVNVNPTMNLQGINFNSI